jgi:hypothetical protein
MTVWTGNTGFYTRRDSKDEDLLLMFDQGRTEDIADTLASITRSGWLDRDGWQWRGPITITRSPLGLDSEDIPVIVTRLRSQQDGGEPVFTAVRLGRALEALRDGHDGMTRIFAQL